MKGKIAHISSIKEWKKAEERGEYLTESLPDEGFIHCSRMEQVLKVANAYYPKRDDLVLIWLDIQKLAAELRWEESDGDMYPHLYGPINLDAVISTVDFPPDAHGLFVTVPAPQIHL